MSFGTSSLIEASAPDGIRSILGRVRLERLLQMGSDAEVVDQETGVLARSRSIHASNRLEQLGVLDKSIEVEHLLDRCVEPGQQHRANQQERDGAGLAPRPGRGAS